MKIKATTAVAAFECLKSDCPDTCCRGWSMQLDDAAYEKYKGAELESAVAHDGKYGEIRVMRRDLQTDYCVKFSDGICTIHKDYGALMLGDACNFYPRVTRKFGDETIMTASLSCPEIARLSLFGKIHHPVAQPQDPAQDLAINSQDDDWVEIKTERLPGQLNDYGAEELSSGQCLKIHQVFLESCRTIEDPALMMARIYSVALSLSRIDKKDWPEAAVFLLKTVESRLPKAISDPADKYKILQIFAAVIHATGKKPSPRLMDVLIKVENRIGVKIDWQTLEIALANASPTKTDHIDSEVLRKYIAAQFSFTTFPHAGLGETPADKAKLLCYKFALVKLLIMGLETEGEIIQAIQSAARITDHIASPKLIFNLMDQLGLSSEPRLRGMMAGVLG